MPYRPGSPMGKQTRRFIMISLVFAGAFVFNRAMEWREGRGAAAGTLLLVSFPDVAAAEHRVAGMSAAGRWAAVARAAGGRDPVFLIESAVRSWSVKTLDDFDRAGVVRVPQPVAAEAAEAFLADQPRGLLLVTAGRYLPDTGALGALLASPRAAVAPDGAPVSAPGITTPPLPRLAGTALVLPHTALSRPAIAVRRLVRATAKPGDGLVSRWLNRPISQRISSLLLLHVPGIRPSHMTMVVAACAAAVVAALFFGGWVGLIAGGVLFHVTSVLDGVDGEIARASYRASVAGATLDTRVDVATNLGYFVGIAVSLTRLYGPRQAMVGAIVVLFGVVGMLLLGWLARRAGRPGSLDVLKVYYRRRFPSGWQHRVTETLVAMTSRDFFAFAFGLIIVGGGGWTVSWLLAGFSAIWLIAIVAAIPGLLRSRAAPAPVGNEAFAGTE